MRSVLPRVALTRVALTFSLMASAVLASAQDAQSVYAKALPSVMTVNTVARDGKAYIGTAFLAISDGLAMTAWHVVADAKSVTVRFSDGEEFESTGLVDKDERRDLALIRVRVKGRPMLTFAEGDPAVGSKAFAVGTPKGLEFSISEGIVSAVRQMDGMRQYQYSAPTNEGNSGGPVLSSDATVLGVVSYKLRDTEGLNFAIPGSYAKALDATLPTQPWGTQSSSQPTGANPQETDFDDKKVAEHALKLRVESISFHESYLDLIRAINTTSTDDLQIPRSLMYAISGLKRNSMELKLLRFHDPTIAELTKIWSFQDEIDSIHLDDLKGTAEYAMKVGWTKLADSQWDEAYASFQTPVRFPTEEPTQKWFALLSGSTLSQYPKDLIDILRGHLVYPTIIAKGFRLDVRLLPMITTGSPQGRSAMDKAGLRAGDTVISFNETPITDVMSFETLLASNTGKMVNLKVKRENGSTRTFKVKL